MRILTYLIDSLKRVLGSEVSAVGTQGSMLKARIRARKRASSMGAIEAHDAPTSTVELFVNSQPFDSARLMEEPTTTLLAAGLVNPFGPTLTAVVAVGEPTRGADLPIVWLLLNPFAQEVAHVGTLSIGQEWRPEQVVPQVFGLPFGACPTLLLSDKAIPEEQLNQLYAEFLQQFVDGCDVLRRLTKHLGDPWERVAFEVEGASGRLPEGTGNPRKPTEVLRPDESAELGRMLASERHARPEIQALLYAWQGAIESAGPTMDSLSLAAFVAVFDRIAASCQIPSYSGTITEIYREMDSNHIVTAALARVISVLELLLDSMVAKNSALALVRLSEVKRQAQGAFSQESEALESTLGILSQIEGGIRNEDFEGSTGTLLALLARLREAEAHTEATYSGRISQPTPGVDSVSMEPGSGETGQGWSAYPH